MEATSWGRVLINRLQKKGRVLAIRCYLCGLEEEFVDHVLPLSSIARILQDVILALIGIKWIFPQIVKETLLSWHGLLRARSARKLGWQSLLAFLNYMEEGTCHTHY